MTDQNNQNETPDPNSETLIGMFSNGNGPPIVLMISGEGSLHPLIPGLAGQMGDPLGDEAKDDDDDLPELIEDNRNSKSMIHGVDEVKGRKMPPPKKETPGTSNVSSTMDDEGNLVVEATFKTDSYTCCVCREGIVGPIIGCENAHVLCSYCIMGIASTCERRCPLCRSVTKVRYYFLEQALQEIIIPCPFADKGCRSISFPNKLNDHTAICRYAEINCPWCKGITTSFDLHTHIAFECKEKFSEIICSNQIDCIKSEEINNIFLVSSMQEGRILYIAKDGIECSIMCIQYPQSEDQINSITMSYSVDVKSLGEMKLTEKRKIIIPIHKPEHLINGRLLIHTIPLVELATKNNITIMGFKEKYMTGGRWMAQDCQGNWFRATICRRLYDPDRVRVKFDDYPSDRYDEWIELHEDNSNRIRPLDANEGRTTGEESRYIESLDEDGQLQFAMERSMNEM